MRPIIFVSVASLSVAAVAATTLSCGGRQSDDVAKPGSVLDPPKSVYQHVSEADEHDREAEAHAELSEPPTGEAATGEAPIECIDQPLAGVPYSGTEPIRVMKPCWSTVAEPTDRHLREAERHRRLAEAHRAAAHELLRVEREACGDLGEDEIAHGPFYHREDVVGVAPQVEGGELAGARIVFRAVPGLDAAWLRRAIGCQQARAAVMGYSRTFLPFSPAVLEDTTVEVNTIRDGYEVILRARDRGTARAILGRARDLVAAPE